MDRAGLFPDVGLDAVKAPRCGGLGARGLGGHQRYAVLAFVPCFKKRVWLIQGGAGVKRRRLTRNGRARKKSCGGGASAPDRPHKSLAMTDPFNLQRFVDAQAGVFDRVEAELRAGRKRSHWMWFVFPQLAGLGFSQMAQFYALASLQEARAYLAHPLLGPRLRACTDWVCAAEGRGLREILGPPDDMKFRSSMTLFAQAAPEEAIFSAALAKFCEGLPDPATLELLAQAEKSV